MDTDFNSSRVIDVEWKFGVTAASSVSEQVGRTYIQMKVIVDAGEGKTKNIFLEMNLPKFYTFLHELEKAKANLDYLK